MPKRINENDVLWLSLVPVVILGIAGVAVGAAFWSRRELRRNKTLRGNMSNLLHHLHSYATANDENFPVRIGRLVDEGYIPWLPINPHTGAPMEEIKPGQTHIAGAFTYIPWRDKTSREIVAATLIGYGRSPRLWQSEHSALPGLPENLPWGYCSFIETTGFLPETIDDLEPAI